MKADLTPASAKEGEQLHPERARAEVAQRESEAYLAAELEDARVLQKLSNVLVSEGGPTGHYCHIIEVARTLMRSNAASIQELDPAGLRLKLLAHTGFHVESAEFWASVDADAGSACGLALSGQKRVVIPNIDAFDAGAHEMAAFRKSEIMSVQSTPLVASSGRIVGMLSTHWNHPHTPSAESYRFFDILARLAADFMERVRSEAALRESEARLRESEARHRYLIGSWAQAVWETDAAGVVVADSPSWRAYTGQTLDEWLGYGWLDAIHPDDRAYAERQWREAVAVRGLVDAEFRLRAPDGGFRWTNVRATPLLDGAGRIEKWVGMNIDIDARKRAEGALRESEEKYRTLFETMGQGYAELEMIRGPDGRAADIRYLELNPQYERLTGIPVGLARGRTVREMVPDFDDWWIQEYDRIVRSSRPGQIENEVTAWGRWYEAKVYPRAGERFSVLFEEITVRKTAEAALREREARFRAVFETMIEACCIFEMIYDDHGRPVDWRILEANAGYERESGLKDVAGKLASDVMPGTEPYWIETFARVVETGEPEQIENWHQPTLRWIHSSTARVGGPGSKRLLSVFYDITERKRAEAASREREERQAFLLELSDALRPLDAAAEIQGEATRLLREHLAAGWCYYVEWDEAAARGVVLRDATREGLPSLVGTHDFSDVPAFLDILRKGNVLNVGDYASFDALSPELRARYTVLGFRSMLVATLVKQGRLVSSLLLGDTEVRDWSGDAEALLMEVAERTWAAVERARAEAALRESEERFRILADNIAQLAWTCDSLGNVTWYNQRWLDYTGSSFDEMKGWSWTKALHPHHVERVVAGVKRSDATGKPWTDTFPLRGRDGQYRWFLSRAIPIHDQRSEIARWFGTNTDVTELREANRAKDEFLAMLGHELRNPLAPIVSTLELMRMDGGRKFEKEREMMLRQAHHLAALLDDLLDVARLARGKIELSRSIVALDELVARAVEAAEPLVEQRRHELHVDVAPGLLVAADEKRIVQVISNLINNAAHYTPPGGHIAISGERDGRSVVLRVRDDGAGIAPNLLPHVFERFQQGLSIDDRSERGLGVGLAIVRSVVELHGGTVTAASEGSGNGSEFTVRLPARARRVRTRSAAPEAPSTASRATGHRILLVDDNRNITDVLALLLVKSGNIVERAYDAVSALSVASTFRPTVAILDIGLPDMSGYELAKQLRKQKGLANIKQIALTGYGGSTDRQRSKRAGFAEHLPKPVDLDELLATIERVSAPLTAKAPRARDATRAKTSKPRLK